MENAKASEGVNTEFMRNDRRKSIEVLCNAQRKWRERGVPPSHREWNIRVDILTLGSRNSRLSGKHRGLRSSVRGGSPMFNDVRSWKRSFLSPKGERIRFASRSVCEQRAPVQTHRRVDRAVCSASINTRTRAKRKDPRETRYCGIERRLSTLIWARSIILYKKINDNFIKRIVQTWKFDFYYQKCNL